MKAIYDEIGTGYSVTRCTDPKIAKQLNAELDGASRIINIGAGTGSYEPADFNLVAVEPSEKMISQRKPGSHPVEQAYAEKLPFEENSFSHAMTVLSMHHWENPALAFSEINRVASDKFVAISWDPTADPFWLTKDYFPEIFEKDKCIFPQLRSLSDHFDDVNISPLPIPSDCKDGLLAAFWKRPQAYLSSGVRQSTSAFFNLANLAQGLKKLENDLASGVWPENNEAILGLSSLDVGYRLITAKVRQV